MPNSLVFRAGAAMRRRDFMRIIGGAAAGWPTAARAQQREQMRRVGFLFSNFPADDPEGQARVAAFIQGLQELGWSVGRNLRIDQRWGLADVDRLRKSAEELVALGPDALVAAGNLATVALQQATRTLPIVFVNVPDPVGAGYVENLARPGGNVTGFMNIEYSQSGKLLELLKQIAPQVKRVANLRTVVGGVGTTTFAVLQAAAPLLGVDVIPINMR